MMAGQQMRTVGNAIKVVGREEPEVAPPPTLGGDTEDLLRSLLGYPQEQIEALAAAGAFGSSAQRPGPYRRGDDLEQVAAHRGHQGAGRQALAGSGLRGRPDGHPGMGPRRRIRRPGLLRRVRCAGSAASHACPPRPDSLACRGFVPATRSRARRSAACTPSCSAASTAGRNCEYHATVFAGDELVATPVIVDIKERQGSLGQMLILTREVRFRGMVILSPHSRNGDQLSRR